MASLLEIKQKKRYYKPKLNRGHKLYDTIIKIKVEALIAVNEPK